MTRSMTWLICLSAVPVSLCCGVAVVSTGLPFASRRRSSAWLVRGCQFGIRPGVDHGGQRGRGGCARAATVPLTFSSPVRSL